MPQRFVTVIIIHRHQSVLREKSTIQLGLFAEYRHTSNEDRLRFSRYLYIAYIDICSKTRLAVAPGHRTVQEGLSMVSQHPAGRTEYGVTAPCWKDWVWRHSTVQEGLSMASQHPAGRTEYGVTTPCWKDWVWCHSTLLEGLSMVSQMTM